VACALKIGSHPDAYSHIEIDIAASKRFQAVKVIADELGSDFVARYRTHPDVYPQDIVYVFPADHAWDLESFQSNNVMRSKARKRTY
jgi:hypothetical protein